MLSRTADHLYWMARYMERAENLARMLDSSYRMSLLPQTVAQTEANWGRLLVIMGIEAIYRARHEHITQDAVLDFMIFDTENPSSILNCLRATRENAHAVRGTLTSELWETNNATWLRMREFARSGLRERGTGELFEWVKYRSHLSRGVTIGTMLQDDALRFIRMGTYLERADNTARILDTKFRSLPAGTALAEPATDYYPWSALLNSVSAFEVYRKVYRDLITPLRVAELLVLRADMPRSLSRCMKEVYANLQAVANRRSGETERRAGELEAELRFGRIEEIVEHDLNAWLAGFLDRTLDLGNRIADDFLVPVAR
ncbi:alpha-E domain-containing protein [Azospira restricta]|uniref:Alpha-E domain-containing protein n=1 Tax=Azospira restricta TaxID=404405 RepID=A0A974PX76_9RHOO|nr:alpha-E domain-containing protein [Azospira restricta]QRJ62660.1 alpha-E domain-containing protein [Azospira restricta]